MLDYERPSSQWTQKLTSLAVSKEKSKNLEHSQAFIVVTENYFSKSCWTSPEGLIAMRYRMTSLILKMFINLLMREGFLQVSQTNAV